MPSRNARGWVHGCAIVLLLAAIALPGCTRGNSVSTAENIRQGTEGIVLSFLSTYSKDIIVGGDQKEDLFFTLKAENRGAYPSQDDGNAEGLIWLSGYDPAVITFESPSPDASVSLGELQLRGKTPYSQVGDSSIIDFKGTINVDKLNFPDGKYAPTILGNLCYRYKTVAQPQVCIEKDPLSFTVKKACTAGDVSLSSQGAPIAVTKVEQLSTATKAQFKLTFRNVGRGIVVNPDKSCTKDAMASIQRYDLDWVRIERMSIAGKKLACGGTGSSNAVRLVDGTGYVTCSIALPDIYQGTAPAFATPLDIEVSYLYKDTIQQSIRIAKIT